MAFKGEISAAILAGKKTGFTTGDIYRIISEGKLGNLDVQFGAFVEWKGTAWEVKKDMQYAVSKTGESLDQAVADVLDDHATSSAEEELTMPAAEAADYTVDNYFEQDGEIWKCTAKTDNGDGTWTIEAEKVNGVIPVLNALINDGDTVKDMTLRFMFSDATYNPQAAGVGTSGTWKKKLDTNYNVWDWTCDNSSWQNAFLNAFIDPSNTVEIIGSGNTNNLTSLYGTFDGCKYLLSVPLFDTSNVTKIRRTFANCENIEFIPNFDTSKVDEASACFINCKKLKNAPNFDLSNVRTGSYVQQMFDGCIALESAPDYDISLCNTAAYMFRNCTELKKVPSLVGTNLITVDSIFNGCRKVTEGALDLYNYLSTKEKVVTSRGSAFSNCGADTTTGAAELAQIPSSWGGTGA